MKPGTGNSAAASAGISATSSTVTPSAVKREPTTPKDKPSPADVKPAVACKSVLLCPRSCISVFII